jgi:hypothetical protein
MRLLSLPEWATVCFPPPIHSFDQMSVRAFEIPGLTRTIFQSCLLMLILLSLITTCVPVTEPESFSVYRSRLTSFPTDEAPQTTSGP